MKAQGISMSMLVIMAIAVLVLLIIGVFFTGGFSKMGGTMMDFVSESADEENAGRATGCNSWCLANRTGSAYGDPPADCICQ